MKKFLTIAAVIAICSATPALANDAMKGDKDEMIAKKSQYYFNKIDSNADGKISKEEHQAFADSMFKSADTNGDGSISQDELRAAKMKEHDEMKNNMTMDPNKTTKNKNM